VPWRAKCYECGQEAPIAIPVFSTLALFAEDSSKVNHRRDGYWKKVTATAAKSDCDDRTVREARAEYYTLTGKGVGATLAGSEVGFDQSNTRYKRGYYSFVCLPDTVDPRGVKK
jgi:hypothetical protein